MTTNKPVSLPIDISFPYTVALLVAVVVKLHSCIRNAADERRRRRCFLRVSLCMHNISVFSSFLLFAQFVGTNGILCSVDSIDTIDNVKRATNGENHAFIIAL